jgi:hypothetical protein
MTFDIVELSFSGGSKMLPLINGKVKQIGEVRLRWPIGRWAKLG